MELLFADFRSLLYELFKITRKKKDLFKVPSAFHFQSVCINYKSFTKLQQGIQKVFSGGKKQHIVVKPIASSHGLD